MFQKCKSGIRNQFLVPFLTNWIYTSFWLCLYHQHVGHLMILKSLCYLSAQNEYCEVNVEGAYINIKLTIGNRESGTGNWFLVPYLRKRLGYFKTVKSAPGNREPGTRIFSR